MIASRVCVESCASKEVVSSRSRPSSSVCLVRAGVGVGVGVGVRVRVRDRVRRSG